jgi:hypothetical protein
MKRTFLALALVVGAALLQPALAQVGTSNGSGSGFLNNDISVGRGGTPGPADLNLRLGGASYLSPYRLMGPRLGVSTVQGRVLSQPAVIDNGFMMNSCGARVITQPAVLDSCGTRVIPQPAVINSCGTQVIQRPAVITMPAVMDCPAVCPRSSNIIIEGTSAPTLVDF